MGPIETTLPRPTDGAPPVIAVSGVAKHFRRSSHERLTALAEVSFELREHEILAVLGPSGCGKSTLLNIIAGIQPADGGQVSFRGAAAAGRRGVAFGYVFQEDRLLPWRTARRNVEFSLEAGSMPRAERRRRALAALDLVGLRGFEDAYPHQLSGGMRSRVALARALVLEPAILLMDEPFGRLDAQTRATMHGELLKIWRAARMSIVFVTHDVEEAVVLADRVMVMAARPGRVKEVLDIGLPRPRDTTTATAAGLVQRLRGLLG